MSFRRLILYFTFLAIFAMAVRVTIDTDTWWHLAAGKFIVESGEIIREDPFSLTRQGQSWIYPGWLAQVVLFQSYELLGLQGLILLTALFVVLAFACIWPLLEGPPLLRASTLILAASVSAVYWSARPQIISFTLSGLFILLLSKVRAGNHRLALFLPLFMALWTNVHGGFAIGFLLIAGFLLGEIMEAVSKMVRDGITSKDVWFQYRRSLALWIGIGFACAASAALNPHGIQMLLYPFKTVSVGALQDYLQEWQSPNFHELKMQPFLWMLLLLLVSLAFSKRDVLWTSIILVTTFAYLSLVAARNIGLFALVSAPMLCKHGFYALTPILKQREPERKIPESIARILNVVILSFMILAAGVNSLFQLGDEFIQEKVSEQIPVRAVVNMRENNLYGNLFNSYNWGGYIIWSLYPEVFSFVDGRTDLFSDELLEEYLIAWIADPGWEDIFDRWDIEVALLEIESPLAKVLGLSGWKVVYEDQQAVVLISK